VDYGRVILEERDRLVRFDEIDRNHSGGCDGIDPRHGLLDSVGGPDQDELTRPLEIRGFDHNVAVGILGEKHILRLAGLSAHGSREDMGVP